MEEAQEVVGLSGDAAIYYPSLQAFRTSPSFRLAHTSMLNNDQKSPIAPFFFFFGQGYNYLNVSEQRLTMQEQTFIKENGMGFSLGSLVWQTVKLARRRHSSMMSEAKTAKKSTHEMH